MARWMTGVLGFVLLASTVTLSACAGVNVPTTSKPAQEESSETTRPGAAPSDAPTEAPPPDSGQSNQISVAEASDIALRAVPGGAVAGVSSGSYRGRATWEALIRMQDGSGVELYIDMATGEVLKRESVPAGDM